MKYGQNLFLLLNFLFLFAACSGNNHDNIDNIIHRTINNTLEDIGVKDYAYLIIKNNMTIAYFHTNKSRTIDGLFSKDILDHFQLPITALNTLKYINKKDSLKSVAAREMEKLLFVSRNVLQSEDRGLYASNQRILNYINRLVAKEHSSDRDKFEGQIPLSDFFQKMLLVEKKFRSDLPQYNSQNRHIENLFPTWYVENIDEFLGYNVLQLGKQAVLWHSFHDQEYEILVIKNKEQQFFAIIAVPYNSMLSTERMNRKDLLQSPLGLCIVEYLIKGADPATFTTSSQLIENRKFLLKAELLRNENPLHADSILETLCKRTQSELYSYRANAPALAEIDNVSDYSNVCRPLVLEKDMTVRIFANGQSAKKRNSADQAYEYDNIQLFINKEGAADRRSAENTRLFQFNVGTGQTEEKSTGDHMAYAFHMLDNSHYTLEIKLPWTKIGFEDPGAGKSLSMNILANDSDLDEDKRKSILSWSMDGYYHFMDVSKYGKVLLRNRKSGAGDEEITSVYTKNPPNIDGLEDPEWRTCEHTDVLKNYSGSAAKDDHAIKFKSLWDKKNIYLLFLVQDNIINVLGNVTKDKCWIRDEASGDIVWKLSSNMISEGAIDVINDQSLLLKAGRYTVHYTSDQSHSYNGWYGRPPVNDLYGISIYRADKFD